MNRLYLTFFSILFIVVSGFFYPGSLQGQDWAYYHNGSVRIRDNTVTTNTQNDIQTPALSNDNNDYTTHSSLFDAVDDAANQFTGDGNSHINYAPPDGGDPLGVPIGQSYLTILALGFFYLFYKLVLNFKKERK